MYDFRTLSPIDFELLVRDLLQAEFSITMESFGPGKDGGSMYMRLHLLLQERKQYFSSSWRSMPNKILNDIQWPAPSSFADG